MRKEDWQGAFGRAPREFNLKIDYTLDKIGREEKIVKKKIISGVLAAALGIAIVGGAALAAAQNWDVFDFANNYATGEITQPNLTDAEKQKLVQTPEFMLESKDVTLKLDEALFDGRRVSAIFTVAPKSTDTLLISAFGATKKDVIPESAGGDGKTTFEQKANAENKKLLFVGAYLDAQGFGGNDGEGNERYNSDGSITFYYSNVFSKAELGAHNVTCMLSEAAEDAEKSENTTGEISISPNTELEKASAQVESQLDCLDITEVEVNRSKLGMYISVHGKLADQLTATQQADLANETLKFYDEAGNEIALIQGSENICDADGNVVESGQAQGGQSYVFNAMTAAGEKMPGSITLKLYNYDANEYGGEVEIPLTVNG